MNTSEMGNSTEDSDDCMLLCLTGTRFPMDITSTSTINISVITMIVYNIVAAVLTTVTNALVIITICTNKGLRKRTFYVSLMFLAMTDFLTGVFIMPVFIVHTNLIIISHREPKNVCFLTNWYDMTSFISAGWSFATVTFITVERFIAVVYALKHRYLMSRSRSVTVTLLLWTISPFMSILKLTGNAKLAGQLSGLIVSSNIIVICVLYAKILITLRKSSLAVTQCEDSRVFTKNAREQKLAKKFVLVVLVLIMCFIPYIIFTNLPVKLKFSHFHYAVTSNLTESLIFLSSLLNPLVYYWQDRGLRKAFWDMLKKRRNDVANFMNNVGSLVDYSLGSSVPRSRAVTPTPIEI